MAGQEQGIQKIMVALDTSRGSLSALQNAVALADRLESEVIGVYVEDINLLRLAQFPFAREVNAFSHAPRPLESLELQRQLQSEAGQARRRLARLCGERGISWQFRVSRGSVAAELLAAAMDADLMIMGKTGRPLLASGRTGGITRKIVARRPGMTLVLQAGALFASPVILVYDGSEPAKKAVDAAGHLTNVHDRKLTVLILAGTPDEARRLEWESLDQLRHHKLGADFRLMVRRSFAGIIQRIRSEGEGAVVLPCDAETREDQLCELIDEIPNPVLLVR
jgi:nucleotide-binding universal stress UspA family protein